MDFTLEHKSEQLLVLRQKPNYSEAILLGGMVMLLVLMAVFFQMPFPAFLFIGFLGLVSLYPLMTERELSCTLDKATGFIVYKRGWGLNDGRAETQYLLADLQVVVIKRQVFGRRRDGFQLQLRVKPGVQFDISAARLKPSQAQAVAQQIQQFVGPSVMVQWED